MMSHKLYIAFKTWLNEKNKSLELYLELIFYENMAGGIFVRPSPFYVILRLIFKQILILTSAKSLTSN